MNTRMFGKVWACRTE